MKNRFLLLLLVIATFASCDDKKKERTIKKHDLEFEVINFALPFILPEHSVSVLLENERESKEDYEFRLKEYYRIEDSIGKNLEIVTTLMRLDNHTIDWLKKNKQTPSIQRLLKAPIEDRNFDSTMIKKINEINLKFRIKPRETIGEGFDYPSLGILTLTRVGFNKDSTMATFSYNFDNGSCIPGPGGDVDVQLKNGKWELMK